MSRTAFHLLRSLNEAPPRARSYSGKSHVFPGKIVDRHFASDRLTDRLIRRLVRDHVIKWKEILESFEFFDQTRKQLRSMGRVSRLSVKAAEQALAHAGLLDDSSIRDGRMGVACGSSTGSTRRSIFAS